VDSLLERELATEQAHVDLVYHHLGRATSSARTVAQSGREIFQSDRETYLREEHGTALFERDAFAFQAARRLAILDAEHEGLVFGRLDLTDPETRYIGRIGVRDEDYEPLVIDWRARAAEPFYRATPTQPMNVVRRRVLRCRNDRVVGIEDDLLDASARGDLPIIGDGALMAALSRARGHQMRDIVATIQAEQDEAIRADHRGVTVIAGGPGTGKTVVALHRAAYLLYSNRRRFERGGILVIGPSALFLNYIERVLPSLGEDSVTLRAIGGVASDVLGFSATRIDPAAAAIVKGSLRMLPLLNRLILLPVSAPGSDGLRVTIKGEVLSLDPTTLSRIRKDVLTRHKANAGRPAAQSAVLDALYAKLPAELELDFDAFSDTVTSSATYRAFMQWWWAALTPEVVLRRLADPAVVARVSDGILDAAEQAALAASFASEQWSVADVALLDELASLLGEAPPEPQAEDLLFLGDGAGISEVVTIGEGARISEIVTTADLLTDQHSERDPLIDTFAHVLVDEAQDLSPMQWRMVRRRGPQASWTIVGDAAQASWPDPNETEEALTHLVGAAPHREYRLSTNYRSPAEVFDLAAAVIRRSFPGAQIPTAVRSTGVQPALLETDDLAGTLEEQLAKLTRDVEGTIGLIVPPARWDEVDAILASSPAAAAAGDRLTMIAPLESKGLEYDAVVVVDPDEIADGSAVGERVLYVCLTRPTQRLVTIDIGHAHWRDGLTPQREE